jgi:hypothetical protein
MFDERTYQTLPAIRSVQRDVFAMTRAVGTFGDTVIAQPHTRLKVKASGSDLRSL